MGNLLDCQRLPSGIAYDEVLSCVPFLKHLNPTERRQLLDVCRPRKFPYVGSYVVKEGERGSEFFILCRGTVTVSALLPDGTDALLAELQPGGYFGEIALLEDISRTASVVTSERNCMLLVLSRSQFNKIVWSSNETTEILKAVGSRRLASNLKAMPFFKDLDDEKIAKLSQLFEFWECPAGYEVFQEGKAGDDFHVIVRGRCRVSCLDVDKVNSIHLRDIGSGDFMGEVALLRSVVRTASVVALEPCIFLTLNSQRFKTLLEVSPSIATALEDVAADREQNVSRKSGAAALSARVAADLSRLAAEAEAREEHERQAEEGGTNSPASPGPGGSVDMMVLPGTVSS